ncbi:hypothetical protein C8R42DRAFT_569728, partial [Lentinula raphanica]
MREEEWKEWWTANASKGARLLKFRRRNRRVKPLRKVETLWCAGQRKRRRRNRHKKRVSLVGGSHAPPSRAVLSNAVHGTTRIDHQSVDQSENITPVCVIADEAVEIPGRGSDLLPEGLDTGSGGVFTRNEGSDGAFRPARVKEILQQVKIGKKLTVDQRERVESLLASYADCFALSISEVRPVPGAIHKLNIPDDAKFSTKVRQKGLTPPQREYLHKKIDELEAAGVIERCSPDQVKCVSPITLAKKAH